LLKNCNYQLNARFQLGFVFGLLVILKVMVITRREGVHSHLSNAEQELTSLLEHSWDTNLECPEYGDNDFFDGTQGASWFFLTHNIYQCHRHQGGTGVVGYGQTQRCALIFFSTQGPKSYNYRERGAQHHSVF
jgi:hypothetical protein